MQVTFTSKFDEGDAVRSEPRSEYPFTGTVTKVRFRDGGFVYEVRDADGGRWTGLRERQIRPA